jgi:hypothetical protein
MGNQGTFLNPSLLPRVRENNVDVCRTSCFLEAAERIGEDERVAGGQRLIGSMQAFRLTAHAPIIIFAPTLYDDDKSNVQVRAGIVKNPVELLGRYVSDLFVRDRSASHVSAAVLPMPMRAKGSRSLTNPTCQNYQGFCLMLEISFPSVFCLFDPRHHRSHRSDLSPPPLLSR